MAKGTALFPIATHVGGPVNPWMVWLPMKGGGSPGHGSARDPIYPIPSTLNVLPFLWSFPTESLAYGRTGRMPFAMVAVGLSFSVPLRPPCVAMAMGKHPSGVVGALREACATEREAGTSRRHSAVARSGTPSLCSTGRPTPRQRALRSFSAFPDSVACLRRKDETSLSPVDRVTCGPVVRERTTGGSFPYKPLYSLHSFSSFSILVIGRRRPLTWPADNGVGGTGSVHFSLPIKGGSAR